MPTGVGCSESAAVWAYQREWDVPLQSSLLLFLSVFDTTTFSLPKLQSDDCKNRGRAPAVDVDVVVVVEEVTITMSQCRAEQGWRQHWQLSIIFFILINLNLNRDRRSHAIPARPQLIIMIGVTAVTTIINIDIQDTAKYQEGEFKSTNALAGQNITTKQPQELFFKLPSDDFKNLACSS